MAYRRSIRVIKEDRLVVRDWLDETHVYLLCKRAKSANDLRPF